MLKWSLIILAVVIGIPAGLAVVGLVLPKSHAASRTIALKASPDRVFAVISNVAVSASWRSNVKSIEMLPDDGNGTRFIEKGSNGDILFRIESLNAPSCMVTRIADPKLPFGGSWTFQLTPNAGGTELTITEDGEVYNPFFRTMQKLFFSPYKTIDTYQADLAKALQ